MNEHLYKFLEVHLYAMIVFQFFSHAKNTKFYMMYVTIGTL